MKRKDLLSILDFEAGELDQVVKQASEMKNAATQSTLEGRTVALLFEKPSLRTRASFEVAIDQLGGNSFFMSGSEVGLGIREPVMDVAKVLSCYVDCIVARVNSHESLQELGSYASIPIINALSNWEHPCQTIADLLTIVETKGPLKNVVLTYIGDGNNVARSLALGVTLLGGQFRIASPPNYGLDDNTLSITNQQISGDTSSIKSFVDPYEATYQTDVIYTDVWTSMGQETEKETRQKSFQNYTVNEKLIANAKSDVILMHPMPVHYGQEIATELRDYTQSVMLKQAENRLHAQKALLANII